MIFYLSSVSSETRADVAELADAIDLGSIVNRRAGSSPVIRIKKDNHFYDCLFYYLYLYLHHPISHADMGLNILG